MDQLGNYLVVGEAIGPMLNPRKPTSISKNIFLILDSVKIDQALMLIVSLGRLIGLTRVYQPPNNPEKFLARVREIELSLHQE